MSDTGATFVGAGASSNANGGTVAWTNPGNITAAGSAYATASIPVGSVTEWLKGTLAFSLPAATIDGVIVDINRSNANNLNIHDSSLKLQVSGTPTGNDKASATNWPLASAFATASYGANNDVWGCTLTTTTENDSTSGIALSVTRTSGSPANTAQVDWFKKTDYYTATPPAANGNWFMMFCFHGAMFVTFPVRNFIVMRQAGQPLLHYLQSAQTRDTLGTRYLDPVASVLCWLERRSAVHARRRAVFPQLAHTGRA